MCAPEPRPKPNPGLQAIEAGRNEEAREACVRKGLKVAATDAAKAKLVRIGHSHDAELPHSAKAGQADILYLARLSML